MSQDTNEYWVIDWRIYDPDGDQKTKLDHVRDMFDAVSASKKLPFRTVLMDSWYATRQLMVHIHRAGKVFYCLLKSNRKVDDSQGKNPYKAVSALGWFDVKIHEFPEGGCGNGLFVAAGGDAAVPASGCRFAG